MISILLQSHILKGHCFTLTGLAPAFNFTSFGAAFWLCQASLIATLLTNLGFKISVTSGGTALFFPVCAKARGGGDGGEGMGEMGDGEMEGMEGGDIGVGGGRMGGRRVGWRTEVKGWTEKRMDGEGGRRGGQK